MSVIFILENPCKVIITDHGQSFNPTSAEIFNVMRNYKTSKESRMTCNSSSILGEVIKFICKISNDLLSWYKRFKANCIQARKQEV